MGDAEKIVGLERVIVRVRQLARDMRDVRAPMKEAGKRMIESIRRNFDEQGRPRRWKAHALSTRHRVFGPQRILIKSGTLRGSFKQKFSSGGVEVGTNVIYARRQHSGYPKGEGRGHQATPARPFAMFQREDVDSIGDIFRRHISRK
jgi:phage virion morphogenesis protein